MLSFIFRYTLDQMVQEFFGGVEEMSNDEMTLWKRNDLELLLRTDPIRQSFNNSGKFGREFHSGRVPAAKNTA